MSNFSPIGGEFKKHTSAEELEVLFGELSDLRQAMQNFDWQATPNVSYHFFLSGHGKKQDFEGLGEAIEQADVFIPEVPGWHYKSLVKLRNIANGKEKRLLKQPIHQSFSAQQTARVFGEVETIPRLIASTGKRIEIIDLPERQFQEPYSQVARSLFFALEQFDSVEELVDHFVYAKALEAKLQLTRELHMMKSLQKLFGRQEQPLEVLIALGAQHTYITRQLKRHGEKVKRTFYPSSFTYSYRDELTRSLIYGKPFSSDTVQRAIAEAGVALDDEMHDETQTSIENAEDIRRSIGAYSPQEIGAFLFRSLKAS